MISRLLGQLADTSPANPTGHVHLHVQPHPRAEGTRPEGRPYWRCQQSQVFRTGIRSRSPLQGDPTRIIRCAATEIGAMMQEDSQARLTLRKGSVKKQVMILLALIHTNNHTPKHLIGNLCIAVDICLITETSGRISHPAAATSPKQALTLSEPKAILQEFRLLAKTE